MDTIKAVQWNIGGAKIRNLDLPTEDPIQYKYELDGLSYIIEILTSLRPDIVALQEAHISPIFSQANVIANALKLPYAYTVDYAESHIEEGQKLGQSIISRWPIGESQMKWFPNPNARTQAPNGEPWISHDKGISSVIVDLPNGKTLAVKTLHMVPFRKFGLSLDNPEVVSIMTALSAELGANHSSVPIIVLGDFNIDTPSILSHLGEHAPLNISEIQADKPTTPRGRAYDHILYGNLGTPLLAQTIDKCPTDHYPIQATFEMPAES